MALGPRLDLRQTQSLVMTPQLQQAIKLLSLSSLEIESFIGEALEANPLLDAGADTGPDTGPETGEPRGDSDGTAPDSDAPETAEGQSADELMLAGQGEADAPLDLDPTALDRDHDTGEWSSSSAVGAERPDITEHGDAAPSLADHLEQQLGPFAPDPQTAFVARYLIGLLDEAGYLRASLREVADDLDIALAEAEAALELVQSLDPTGVGARDLGECLALQAREADRHDPCMAVLLANLDALAKGDVARLKRICNVDDEDFADMLGELRSYDPKPGLRFGGGVAAVVVPDILLTRSTGQGWSIRLNEASLPRLVVNRQYYLTLRDGASDKTTGSWLNEKLADANWLIRALDQRQKTILKVTQEIVKQQAGFFDKGVAHLRPLTLRDVAAAIEMHESTVSRVTSNKYLECARGLFELKYFFTSGVGSSDGEGASAEAVKARIKALTDAEDPKKILSDDALVDLLKAEGFDLARRTVAKYREAIGIGSSVQRRRAKKLLGV